MEKNISISQFIQTIQYLPADEPRHNPRAWYSTQKEHWLGWLNECHGPGAFHYPELGTAAAIAWKGYVQYGRGAMVIDVKQSKALPPISRSAPLNLWAAVGIGRTSGAWYANMTPTPKIHRFAEEWKMKA